MFSKMKYFFIYCYEASEKMEEKAAKFEAEREKRIEAFRADRQAVHEQARERMEDVKGEVRTHIKETLNTMGVATGDEVDEIKTLLTDLTKKVDNLAK